MTASTTLTRERADLIESLRRHRSFLRFTVRGLTDGQALRRPTASALDLAGLRGGHVLDQPGTPMRSSPPCPTWTPTTRCRRRPGSSRVPAGRPGGWSCTSSRGPRSTPGTPGTPGTPTS
jgi:hypothetical protein